MGAGGATAASFAPLLAVAASFLPHLPHSTDDAFITHRCAWNVALGEGLVFNAGETHLATTAPGFAITLGWLGRLFGLEAIPVLAGAISLASLCAAAGLLARWFAPHAGTLLAILLLGVASSRWLIEILGHETPTQALLVLAGAAALDRDRQMAAGLFLAAATAIRPDAGAFGAVLGLHHWLTARRFPLRLAVAYGVPLLLVAGGILLLSGTLLPASLAVKRAEASVPLLSHGRGYVEALVGWFARDYGLSSIPLLMLAAIGITASTRGRPPGRLLVVTVTAILFYPLMGVTFSPWYFVLPLLTILAFASLPLAMAIDARHRTGIVLAATASLLAVATPAVWIVANGAGPPDPRMRPNRAVAEWIRQSSTPQDSLAAVEVGFLAYFSQRTTIDLIGLGSEGALEALVDGHVADYFYAHSPTFLVRHPVFDYIQAPILEDARFHARYRLAHAFLEVPDEPVIEVYRRIDP